MKNNIRSGIKENKLLSICIPTFNRADYLKNTLNSIIGQKKFSELCEVIISDNNSTDNTRDVGKYFSDKYDNIRYYRNEANIGAERNFLKLLNYGQGKYLKLHNDRACFYENKLNKLVTYLENVEHNVIFILNENNTHKNKEIIECNNFDEFICLVSFWSTWMNGIILKKSEYINLKEKDRAVGSEIIQTDIMFSVLSIYGSSLVINEKLLYEQEVKSKGGYNLFEVFVSNYLELYQDYLKADILSQKTYKKEKIDLLTKFVFPWYTKILLIKDNKYQFDVSKAHRIILEHYWNEPMLYLYPLYLINKFFLNILQKISRV